MPKKEDKYFVMKLDDMRDYLTEEGFDNMMKNGEYISNLREDEGREPKPRYIVVNEDEPYADKVWEIVLNGEREKEEKL